MAVVQQRKKTHRNVTKATYVIQARQHLHVKTGHCMTLVKVQTLSSGTATGTNPVQLLFCTATPGSKGKWTASCLEMYGGSQDGLQAQAILYQGNGLGHRPPGSGVVC